MNEAIIYRNLTAADYEQMLEVWNKSGLPTKPVGRDSRAELSAHMKEEPDFFIGAFDNNKLIGLIIATSDKRKGWINRPAVIPEYRRRGIARSLIHKAEAALYKTGIRIISCLIFKDNTSSRALIESENYDGICPALYFRKALNDEV